MGQNVIPRPITALGVPGFNGDGSGLTNIPGTALASGAVGSSQLDPSVQQKTVVLLTAAQLIAMFTTPVSILPAPGAGKAILVDQILLEFTGGTVAFTGGGTVDLVYHGTGTVTHSGTLLASVLTGTASTVLVATLLGGAVPTNGTVVPANTGLDITNITAAFAAGNGTAKVTVWYSIVPL